MNLSELAGMSLLDPVPVYRGNKQHSAFNLILKSVSLIIQGFTVYFETHSFFPQKSSYSMKRKENTFLCRTFEFILLNRCGLIFFTVAHLWHFIRSPGHFICTLHFGSYQDCAI